MTIKKEVIVYVEAHPYNDEDKTNLIGLILELLEPIEKWDGKRPTTLKNLFPEERRNSIPRGDHLALGRHVSNLVKLNVLPIKHAGKVGNTYRYTKIL